MVQYSLEMAPLPEDWRPVQKDVAPSARLYRFKSSAPANIVDQITLTTDLGKSEFVACSIRLGALFVRFAGADALRAVSVSEEDIEQVLQALKNYCVYSRCPSRFHLGSEQDPFSVVNQSI